MPKEEEKIKCPKQLDTTDYHRGSYFGNRRSIPKLANIFTVHNVAVNRGHSLPKTLRSAMHKKLLYLLFKNTKFWKHDTDISSLSHP
jgi:hypothetical protein